jgi:hypothetical protein
VIGSEETEPKDAGFACGFNSAFSCNFNIAVRTFTPKYESRRAVSSALREKPFVDWASAAPPSEPV